MSLIASPGIAVSLRRWSQNADTVALYLEIASNGLPRPRIYKVPRQVQAL
jgi:hypothetical protein